MCCFSLSFENFFGQTAHLISKHETISFLFKSYVCYFISIFCFVLFAQFMSFFHPFSAAYVFKMKSSCQQQQQQNVLLNLLIRLNRFGPEKIERNIKQKYDEHQLFFISNIEIGKLNWPSRIHKFLFFGVK